MNKNRQGFPAALSKALLLALLIYMQAQLAAAPGKAPVDSAEADVDVREFRLEELEAKLLAMQPGPEHDYFAGVLANRSGRLEESIRLLNSALPGIRTSHPDRAAIALLSLADNYNKTFRYADAAQAYDDLLAHFASELVGSRFQDTKDDSGLAHLLRDAPPQTITWDGPTRLKTERNPLGSINTELTVNGVREEWLLDTGANLSVATRSFANRLRLKLLPGVGQTTSGVTGIENPLQLALLPALQMGGATLHNVVIMVMDDASLKVGLGKESYQINGIIGYPVYSALGTVTFLQNGEFVAGDKTQSSRAGARMYMEQLTPVIECVVQGRNLPFTLDTGASATNLSVRYYDRFRAGSASWKKAQSKSFGAGGVIKRKVYLQPELSLGIGDKTATLQRVIIFPSTMGAGIDNLYGNLGQDVWAKFDSFTLNFSTMTFSLGDPLPPPASQ
ncbi:MAG: aspartyl protease family protein [Candidatus Acidiferrales bacterium]